MFKFKQRIPVTVIGGFLGAGKTTLVNRLIEGGTHKFGVIVNEFGDVGIDGSLIENLDSDGVAELANGCLCCVSRDDLVTSMVRLGARDEPPEYVLIELSGLADPVPVAQTVLDPYVKPIFELDGIIGVADARNLATTIQSSPEGAVQLAYASTIVLNKIDLASADELEQAHTLARKLSPLAPILEAENARVNPDDLLGLRAFDPDWQPEGHNHQHTPGVTSFVLESEQTLDWQALNSFVERYIVARPADLYRAKGFLSVAGFDKEVLFQSVREIFNIGLSDRAVSGCSKLVVIGRGLDEDEYRRAFATLSRPKRRSLGNLLGR